MKSYCPAPFKVVCKRDTGYSLCCEAPTQDFDNYKDWWDSDYINNVREQMKNGERVADCDRCYRNEAAGNHSLRDVYLHEYSIDDYDIEPEIADVRIGNLCNLKCIMCWGKCSSQIDTEWKQNKEVLKDFITEYTVGDNLGMWDELASISTLKHIKLIGGEPLIHKEFDHFLENINPDIAKHIKLEIVTNGTRDITPIRENILKFKEFILNVSIDGYGELNDYIRSGSKWDKVMKNLEIYQTLPNCFIKINTTIQASNIHSIHKIIELGLDKHLIVCFIFVDNFQLVLDAVPQHILEQAVNDINAINLPPVDEDHPNLTRLWETYYKDIDGLVRHIENTKFNYQAHAKFLQYINSLDRIRKTRYLDVSPQWQGYF